MNGTLGRWVRFRLLIATGVVAALFTALAGKAATLQLRDGKKMRALGEQQYLQELVLPAPRGSIHDANGVELALSVDVPSAYVNPRLVADVAGGAGPIAQALGLDVREVEEKLASGRHFEWLKRHISPTEARKVRALGLVGIGLAEEPQRFYPGQALAAAVLGSADIDGRGVDGIELSLDETLRGRRTKLPVIRDRRGVVVMDSTLPAASIAGATVTLSLDRYIQFTAERALAEGLRENKAKGGVALVLDPRSGAVLAMASSDTRNRPVTDAYEPGSVMKVFSVVSALDAGAVKPDDLIDVEGGRIMVGKHLISDTHLGRGLMSISEIIKISSNVGATKIARRLGKERLHDALERLGFGQRTGIDLPGETRGRLRDAAKWGEAGLATTSYGYGLQVSPLQIASALGAVATGGTYYKPFIVKRIVDADGKVLSEANPEPKSVIGTKAARAMVEMMKGVVQKGGTAQKLSVPGFIIAGKTGTAYKLDPATKKYTHEKFLSSFIGVAPADDPRVAIVVMIDEPDPKRHLGGDVAGPIFVAIATESLKYLGVAATERIEAKKPGDEVLDIDERAVRESLPDEEIAETTAIPSEMVAIPDFAGLSVAQALGLAQARGVKIEVEGTGRAKKQFPPPGRALKSITCHVTFDPG